MKNWPPENRITVRITEITMKMKNWPRILYIKLSFRLCVLALAFFLSFCADLESISAWSQKEKLWERKLRKCDLQDIVEFTALYCSEQWRVRVCILQVLWLWVQSQSSFIIKKKLYMYMYQNIIKILVVKLQPKWKALKCNPPAGHARPYRTPCGKWRHYTVIIEKSYNLCVQLAGKVIGDNTFCSSAI